MATKPQLLFIDAYDSFSNNIITLVKSELQAELTVIKIDDARFIRDSKAFHHFLQNFDGVIAGPGPGHPGNFADIGILPYLWTLPENDIIPVLGICLGFQNLVFAHGGKVERLKRPRHGIVRPVIHCGSSIFEGVGEIYATQYHSLTAKLQTGPQLRPDIDLWLPAGDTDELQSLAWDLSDNVNGPVLMAVRHTKKPFYGVQYHPESICTNDQGRRVFSDWWRLSSTWHNQVYRPSRAGPYIEQKASEAMPKEPNIEPLTKPSKVQWKKVSICSSIDYVPLIRTLIKRQTATEPIILESGVKNGIPVNRDTGRYTIMALNDQDSNHIKYWSSSRIIATCCGTVISKRNNSISEVFNWLKSYIEDNKATSGPYESPFWGGMIGYISYEAGLETLSIEPLSPSSIVPDIHFVGVKRSIIIDHIDHTVTIQSLLGNDSIWLREVVDYISELASNGSSFLSLNPRGMVTQTLTPGSSEYCDKVRLCQSYIAAGDSYELCLTDQSKIATNAADNGESPSAWELYQLLRRKNPAPFGAMLDLNQVKVVGSSPERFLSWSRSGTCEYRPIKGTIKKTPSMTLSYAEQLLNVEKERAENLMIVDLIRHDLNGVLASSNNIATVPKLMQVEEYESVFQLVSIIRGELGNDATQSSRNSAKITTGIDVLHASLPPGSMTGAPKKRSCEILQDIEKRRRGLYSGVLGYMDVGGGGDFSVIIRTMIKEDDGWTVGSGGAVTALSDAKAEWEEMLIKSMSVRI